MSIFNLKLSTKESEELAKYINFQAYKGCRPFKEMNSKIVYMNSSFPDKHIYEAFYMDNSIAYSLSYRDKENIKANRPMFTLQELHFDDHIVFYTNEDVEKIKERKKTKP